MTGTKLRYLVESMFDVVRHRCTETEIAVICPVPGCGDISGNMSFSLRNGRCNCWRCNSGGDSVKFLRWLGYDVNDDGNSANSLDELFEALQGGPKLDTTIVPVISEIDLPGGFIACSNDPYSEYTKQIGKMAVRKNLEPEDLIAAGVGFTRADSKWNNYAIFPVTEYGKLVYFQGRTYWDTPGESTKLFPGRREAPLSSKYWVYGIDEVRGHKEVSKVVIVESILNVLSLKKKFREEGITDTVPVCVFKHSVSRPQLYKLLRCKNVKEIIMLFDLDAYDLSYDFAPKAHNLVKVSIAKMPDSDNKKLDANDDVDAAMIAIDTRSPYCAERMLDIKLERARKVSVGLPGSILDKAYTK